jgi:hypothetical protein
MLNRRLLAPEATDPAVPLALRMQLAPVTGLVDGAYVVGVTEDEEVAVPVVYGDCP